MTCSFDTKVQVLAVGPAHSSRSITARGAKEDPGVRVLHPAVYFSVEVFLPESNVCSSLVGDKKEEEKPGETKTEKEKQKAGT